MDEPNPLYNFATFRTAGQPTFTRDWPPSTTSNWGSNRQESQVNIPSKFLSHQPCEQDRGAILRPTRVGDFVQQDNMRRTNSNPIGFRPYINPQSIPRPRKLIKLAGGITEHEEQPSSSFETDHTNIINQMPPNLNSSPSPMLAPSIFINAANNQDMMSVGEGRSGRSTAYRFPASIPHQFTNNNSHHLPINDQGLAVTHPGKVTNYETRRDAREEEVPNHAEDKSADLLEFDKTVFACSEPNFKDETNLLSISDMFCVLNAKKLVMSEQQFITHFHRYFNKNCSTGKPPPKNFNLDLNAKPQSVSAHRRRDQINAISIILQDREWWYRHWEKKTGIKIKSLANDMNNSPSPQMLAILITYLFYVEMISTLVPREQDVGDATGSQLKEAVNFFKALFLPESISIATQIRARTDLDPQEIKERAPSTKRSTNFYAGLWMLLAEWMRLYRTELFKALKEDGKTIRTTQNFFNTVFRYTVENLGNRLKGK
ncbi:hypothetical protein PTTG_26343 [Puccinia triticina 1-1 BBBD Race 1]|uniref:Uncharacterized protein n=1 Tax=Puccinia triticina (isolate 1-1 / race 1 (BBBD)) TaxID=630390 RepID=A0A180GUU5_PUCT1|nr:hypothetical protein PTTG_26343 [Puccinia triticina 1-1 BBBD Race 1]WAR54261.1 hypothetical protein PtB15_3B775 [Puccinia triticina]